MIDKNVARGMETESPHFDHSVCPLANDEGNDQSNGVADAHGVLIVVMSGRFSSGGRSINFLHFCVISIIVSIFAF